MSKSVTLSDLSTDADRVAALARQPGGVQVTDDKGAPIFRLVIPAAALPIEHCPGCCCRDDRAAIIIGSYELQDAARQYRAAGERVLYVLSRYPDVEFTPAQLIRVTHSSDAAIRMALKRLGRNGQIRHLGYARWQALEAT